MPGVAAAAAPMVTSAPTSLAARVMQWAARFLKSNAGSYVWPPSRRSSMTYAGAWGVLFLAMYFGFIRTGKSKFAEWEMKRKREYAAASIKNLLEYEAQRKKDEAIAKAEKDKTAEETTSPPDDQPASARAVDAAKESEGASAVAAVTEKKSDKKKNQAPDAKRMLGLLLDDVENGSIVKLGVSASAEWYKNALQLLKERVEFELREAIDETRIARGVMKTKDNDPATLAKSEEWKDGEKLSGKIKLVKDEVYKAFGKQLIDRACAIISAALHQILIAHR